MKKSITFALLSASLLLLASSASAKSCVSPQVSIKLFPAIGWPYQVRDQNGNLVADNSGGGYVQKKFCVIPPKQEFSLWMVGQFPGKPPILCTFNVNANGSIDTVYLNYPKVGNCLVGSTTGKRGDILAFTSP